MVFPISRMQEIVTEHFRQITLIREVKAAALDEKKGIEIKASELEVSIIENPSKTADQRERLDSEQRHLVFMNGRIRWLERRSIGCDTQILSHEFKIRVIEEKIAAEAATATPSTDGHEAPSASVLFIGTDKPLGGQFNGHRKNPNQVARSRADLTARGRASSNSGQKNGRKDGRPQNAKGKKARKAAARQVA